eukprot:10734131-Alexandrium_andersonii.AAC.1
MRRMRYPVVQIRRIWANQRSSDADVKFAWSRLDSWPAQSRRTQALTVDSTHWGWWCPEARDMLAHA